MEFDIFTFLPLAVAVFVLWKLRSVLGTRNGAEKKPPFDPYTPPENTIDDKEANDNVVTLPNARKRRASDETVADPIAE